MSTTTESKDVGGVSPLPGKRSPANTAYEVIRWFAMVPVALLGIFLGRLASYVFLTIIKTFADDERQVFLWLLDKIPSDHLWMCLNNLFVPASIISLAAWVAPRGKFAVVMVFTCLFVVVFPLGVYIVVSSGEVRHDFMSVYFPLLFTVASLSGTVYFWKDK